MSDSFTMVNSFLGVCRDKPVIPFFLHGAGFLKNKDVNPRKETPALLHRAFVKSIQFRLCCYVSINALPAILTVETAPQRNQEILQEMLPFL